MIKSFLLFTTLTTLFTPLFLAAQEIHEEWDVRHTNGIAALVEDKIITLEEVRRELAPLVPQIRSESRSRMEFDRNIELVTREVLQNMVDRILILKEFNDKGMIIPEDYVTRELNDYVTREFRGDRAEFLRFLELQGKNERQFREEFKERIIVNYMRGQMVNSQSSVSPQRIEEYYQRNRAQFVQEEGVKLRLIMLKPVVNENPDLLQQQANEIIEQLGKGADFGELARQYSQDDRKDQGGDWGWINRNHLIAPLSSVAFDLSPGQYSEPVRVDDLIYILKVEDKREEGYKDLDRVRSEIESAITVQLSRQAQQRWLERLRRNAFIKYYLKEADAPSGERGPVRMRIGEPDPTDQQLSAVEPTRR